MEGMKLKLRLFINRIRLELNDCVCAVTLWWRFHTQLKKETKTIYLE